MLWDSPNSFNKSSILHRLAVFLTHSNTFRWSLYAIRTNKLKNMLFRRGVHPLFSFISSSEDEDAEDFDFFEGGDVLLSVASSSLDPPCLRLVRIRGMKTPSSVYISLKYWRIFPVLVLTLYGKFFCFNFTFADSFAHTCEFCEWKKIIVLFSKSDKLACRSLGY